QILEQTFDGLIPDDGIRLVVDTNVQAQQYRCVIAEEDEVLEVFGSGLVVLGTDRARNARGEPEHESHGNGNRDPADLCPEELHKSPPRNKAALASARVP